MARYQRLLAHYDSVERPAVAWRRMVADLADGEAVCVRGWQLPRGVVAVDRRERWFRVEGDGRLVELEDVPR